MKARKVRKRIPLVSLLLILAMLLAACSTEKVPQSDAVDNSNNPEVVDNSADVDLSDVTAELDLVWVHSGASNQSEQRVEEGFRAYVTEQGWDWNITTVNSDSSSDKLANNISDAAANGCDAIVVSMGDLRASTAALAEANAAGIPVFTVDCGYTEGAVVDITCNNYVMAAKIGTYVTDYIGGMGNVLLLTNSTDSGLRKRGEIITDVILAECPGITVLDEHNIDLTDFYNDSANAMEDWIARFGGSIDAIICCWDEPGMAVTNVLLASGYTRDDCVVVGIDGNENALEMMRDGAPYLATVAQPFEIMGQRCASVIQKIVVQQMDWDTAVGATTLYMDSPLITPNNLPDEGTPAYLAVDFYSQE